MEIPTIVGLGLGFDGTSNWVNKHLVDKLILGVDEFRPEEYTVARKFFVMWMFLTVFTLLLYFTLCPLSYWLFFTKKKGAGEAERNAADWDQREGKDQIANEIKLSAFSIVIMAGMTAPFELLVEHGYTKIYWVRSTSPHSSTRAVTRSQTVKAFYTNFAKSPRRILFQGVPVDFGE
jgi:lathosterol oxidase